MSLQVKITVTIQDSTYDVVLSAGASTTTGNPLWLAIEAEEAIAKAGRTALNQVRLLAGGDIRDQENPPETALKRERPLTGGQT